MPGWLLAATKSASQEAGIKTMGMYKLTIPGSLGSQESRLGSKGSSGFRNGISGNRNQYVDDYKSVGLVQQPANAKAWQNTPRSMESTEVEQFWGSVAEVDEENRRRELVVTAKARDEYSTMPMPVSMGTMKQFGSRGGGLTSVTVSDDDLMLSEITRRTSAARQDDYAPSSSSIPTRHSTASCSDLAFRRELRKRLRAEPHATTTTALDVEAYAIRRDSTSSLAMGSSFRRELEKEDRVESLALWEETDHHHAPASPQLSNIRSGAAQNALPHSWHAGDMARASASSRNNRNHNSNGNNNVLDSILRKKKPSFFNGLFSGLSFSSSRKSRKAALL